MRRRSRALLIPSGNDAAIAIAETFGEGMKTDDSQTANEAFVAAMNAKAAELGMTDTLFDNPHGLDIGAYDNEMYSCAGRRGDHGAYAMGNETFRAIVGEGVPPIPVTRADGKPQHRPSIHRRLLGTYEGAYGIKTGYTEAAGPRSPARAIAATAFCTPSSLARPPRTRASRMPRRCSTGSTTRDELPAGPQPRDRGLCS